MRTDWSHLEPYRVRSPRFPSKPGEHFGAFYLRHPGKGHYRFAVIATDGLQGGEGWEHVSVHVCDVNGSERLPGWAEMDHLKDLFWEPSETVVQYHVPKTDHVNVHPFTLHLWRPTGAEMPRPPQLLV
jgi:hypothetical protein